jgi:hypothetical protein
MRNVGDAYFREHVEQNTLQGAGIMIDQAKISG